MTMKKIFVVVLTLSLLVPIAANATISRVIGIGGVDANYIIVDPFNPALWPQLVHSHPNLAGVEITGTSYHTAYVNYSFGEEKSVVGFALTNRRNNDYTLAPNVDQIAGGALTGTPNMLSILYGRPMGESMLVGLGLSLYGNSTIAKESAAGVADDYDAGHSIMGIKVGVSDKDSKWDAALGIEMASWNHDVGGTSVNESDGAMALRFDGRWWHDYSDNASLVPNLRFMTRKDAATYADGPNGANDAAITTTDIKLGCGHNWRAAENALIIFELGVEMWNEKSEMTVDGAAGDGTITSNHMPYWRLGFESKLLAWLTARAGGERTWTNTSLDEGASILEPEYATTMTTLFLGATAHWGRLYMDMVINPAFVTTAPYSVTGMASNMWSRLSLKIDLNK